MTRTGTGTAEAADIRNVVLVGLPGTGKTTLAESALYLTGSVNRLGLVADGTTVCDFEEVERRLGHSVSMTVASTTVRDAHLLGSGPAIRLNIVDTPGHADFIGELRAGLRAADAAVFVISAVDGVDGGTRVLWQECAAVGMPRAVVITHVDQPRGDFATAMDECRRAFGDGVQPVYLPADAGLLGLLSGALYEVGDDPRERTRRPATAAELTAGSSARNALIERIITESEDDSLLDRYLGGEEVDFDTVVRDLAKAFAAGSFHPALPAVPTTGLGVAELIELICRGFPSPAEHPVAAYTPAGALLPDVGLDGPLIAEVVKTTTDPYVGRVSLVRVYRGALEPDASVHVSGHFAQFSGQQLDETRHPAHDFEGHVGTLSRSHGATLTGVSRAGAGDIVAVARLAHAETGDTLSDPASPAVLAPWHVPEPLLPTAISAKSSTDEDKLSQGLSRIVAEDPTVRVEMAEATEQLVIWTVGGRQLEVLLDRLRARSGVEVLTHQVLVALRETVRAPAEGLGRHVKQSGGHGQFAIAQIQVEPLPEGAGFEFVDKVVGGAVPRQYIPSVEKGVRHQLDRGVTGHPMVDVRVTLVGGKSHSVDSSDAAFQMAGALALREAATAAGIQVLEPLDSVVITVDDDFVGAVLADLSSRRGRVRGTATAAGVAGRSEVLADVPSIELTRYAAELRSLGHGTGAFTREYQRHIPAPDTVLDRLAGKQ